MGFFKKVFNTVAAVNPVVLVPKVFSNVLDNVAPGNPITSKISDAFSAPYEVAVKGAKPGDALKQALPALQMGASALGGPLGSSLGMDLGAYAKFLPDMNAAAPMQEDRGYSGGVTTVYAAPTPPPPNITPYVLGAGAIGLILIVALRRS